MEKEEQFQPKDTGKLTNYHYGTKEDRRTEEALTNDGTVKMESVEGKNN
ncbi:hypothetical protein PY093_02125 [Cytobacillus sp. S13-E01]|nr:hypothetical protein [Cytobacillus sp. S13-E01]MDF0725508.1 hypothetical protein [Cytobacillus sp. S13-E01]